MVVGPIDIAVFTGWYQLPTYDIYSGSFQPARPGSIEPFHNISWEPVSIIGFCQLLGEPAEKWDFVMEPSDN